MHSEKCPVCEGRGHVPQGFYLDLCSTTGTTGPIQCRGCFGKGYLLISEEIKFIPETFTGAGFKITCDAGESGFKNNEFTIQSGEVVSSK